MKKNQTLLFQNITESEWNDMSSHNYMRTQHFDKNAILFCMGDIIREIGIVLSGSINIETVDLWGNKSLLNNIHAGHLFAETYALCNEPIMVNAVAAETSEILFLSSDILTDSRYRNCSWHAKITENMLYISLQKNQALANRIFCTTPKTIRERLLIYLSSESSKAKSTSFQIPFNRQELADYLNLDRSALSKELGKMRNDGILRFHKNQFTLLDI